MKGYLIIAGLLFMQLAIAQDSLMENTSKVWSFEECVKYALENNITVKDASLSTNLAEVDYSKSKSAKLPNLFGSASQNFSNGNTIDPITSDFVTEQIHSTSLGLNSSVTLFQGNQLNNQIKQNKLFLEQSLLLEEVEKNNIVLNLLEAYLQALYSKENIAIAENNLNASENEVRRAKARFDAGVIALSEYTEAQSQAATHRYNVISAKNTYRQYIISLKQLLELSPMDELDIETVDVDVLTLNVNKADVYASALNFLPEVKATDLTIDASEKQLDIVKGAYLPTLALSGSLGTGYTSINQNSFSDQFNVNFNQRLALSLNVPIFNRNQTKSAVQSATINIEKAQIQKQSTEKEIYKKIEMAYQNALSAQEQVVAAQSSQAAAAQSYKLAQKKYAVGDLSTTDLVISQNVYTNAQQNYLQAKYLNVLYYQLLQFYQGNEIQL